MVNKQRKKCLVSKGMDGTRLVVFTECRATSVKSNQHEHCDKAQVGLGL